MSDDSILEWLGSVQDDPLEFVLGAFPWGEGVLKNSPGPEVWQIGVLEMVRDGLPMDQAVQIATAYIQRWAIGSSSQKKIIRAELCGPRELQPSQVV